MFSKPEHVTSDLQGNPILHVIHILCVHLIDDVSDNIRHNLGKVSDTKGLINACYRNVKSYGI